MSDDEGARPTVVVVGAINVDLVVETERLPAPGETVLGGGSMRRHGGGKGANAAVAAARAGARTMLVGAIGADDEGRNALDELAEQGVDVANVAVIDDVSTGVALIVVAKSGENQIAVGAGANMRLSDEHVSDALHRLLPTADCVLISTEIAPDAVRAAVRLATGAGVPCVLNPAPVTGAVTDVLALGPMLTPNATELADLHAALAPPDGDDVRIASDMARVVGEHTRAAVVVTLGADGALLLVPGTEPIPVPPRRATVRDTTGAGDTFNGVLAFRIAAGEPLDRAVHVATAAASLSVGSIGARSGMPTADEIDAVLAGLN